MRNYYWWVTPKKPFVTKPLKGYTVETQPCTRCGDMGWEVSFPIDHPEVKLSVCQNCGHRNRKRG